MSAEIPRPDGRDGYLLGLLGHGVTASLTPTLHVMEADRRGLRYLYRPVEVPDEARSGPALGRLLRGAQVLGFDALNITYPLKQAVAPHLDALAPAAARLNAVNTVLVRDGLLIGHNTDLSGFTAAVRGHLTTEALGAVLVVGAGGAGAAVTEALLELGAGTLLVVDQDGARARGLAGEAAARHPTATVVAVPVAELPRAVGEVEGVVHCTPTGMAHQPGVPFDPDLLDPAQWVADVVYRPLETELLRAARARGCRVLHGGYMAVYQASHTFTLVTGLEPDPLRMLDDLDRLVAPAGR